MYGKLIEAVRNENKVNTTPKVSLDFPAISLTLKETNGVYSFDINKDLRNNTPN